jgi:hypothetical protein
VRTTGPTLKSAEPSAEVVNAVASQLVRICPLKCAPSEIEQAANVWNTRNLRRLARDHKTKPTARRSVEPIDRMPEPIRGIIGHHEH